VIPSQSNQLKKSTGDFIRDVHPIFWVIVAGLGLILLTLVLIVLLTWYYINSGVWCCGGACINKYLAGPPTKDDILKAKQSKCVKAKAPLVLADERDVRAEVEGLRDDTSNKLLDKLYEPPAPSSTLAGAIQKVINEAKIGKYSKYELKKALCRSLQWAEKTERKVEGMTDDLAASIHLYTQETVLYRNINAFLRGRQMEDLDPYFQYVAMLLEAVQLLDLHDVCVYRGIKKDLNKDYVVGETVMWWAFSSTTNDPEVLMNNALFLGKKGKRTMFTIVAKCVDIQQYSVYADEHEFLLLPPSRFEVMSKSKDKTGLWTIQLAHHDDQRRFALRERGGTESSMQTAAHI